VYPSRRGDHVKRFTVEEALAALPEVALHVQRMVDARAALLAAEHPSSRFAGAVRTNGSGPAHKRTPEDVERADELRGTLMAEVEAIERLGVVVKDVDSGLVDFPAAHPVSGDPVYLCWQLGEETIGFWHPQDAGFAGRKPLPFS